LFDSIVDLKPLVLKRLFDYFPGKAVSLALRPERLVRLTFQLVSSDLSGFVYGWFRNVGVGPALDLAHGVHSFSEFMRQYRDGGLAVNQFISRDPNGTRYDGRFAINRPHSVYCSYSNVFGDRYRVEAELEHPLGEQAVLRGERFFVGSNELPEEQLVEVTPPVGSRDASKSRRRPPALSTV
jgi:hypothetical protein